MRPCRWQLAQGWDLQQRLPLPNWGDTVEDLTVWTRKPSPLPATPPNHPVLACEACAKPATLGTAGSAGSGGVKLRRCRYCRLACYCSAACELEGAAAHAAYHAVKMIAFNRPLEFSGRDYHAI